MKVKVVKFARRKKDQLDRAIQAVNTLAKRLGVTYKIKTTNKPSYDVDPRKGVMISSSNKKIPYENYTKVASTARYICNGEEMLLDRLTRDMIKQFRQLLNQIEI